MVRRRAFWTALIAVSQLLLLAPAGASGGKIPESAYSRSLGIRPELLGYTTLVFQHPQRAPLDGSLIYGSTGDYSEQLGVGVIGETRGNALFFLMQKAPTHMPGGADLFQAGWGASWDGVRVGVAVRGTYRRSDAERYEEYGEEIEYFQHRIESRLQKTLEPCFGLGLEKGPLTLDLAVDYTTGDTYSDYLNRSHRSGDTLAVHLEDEADPFFGVTGRIGFRLGDRAELILGGSYAAPDRDFTITVFQDSLGIYEEKNEGELWSTGLAVLFPVEQIDRVFLSGMIHVEDDAINRDYYSGRRIEFNRTEKYWLAASFEHELEGRLTVRGGAEARYEQTKTSACQIDGHDSFWRDETETRESIGYGFSWGAGYTWRMFELNGMARTDLDLTSLFVALDARIRL